MAKRKPAAAPPRDPRIRHQPLPGILGQIERLIGYDLAVKFALEYGGTTVYLPRDPPADHAVAKTLGLRAARVVCRALGGQSKRDGGSHRVPTGEIELKWNEARRLRLQGCSRNEIVRRLRRDLGIVTTIDRVTEMVSDLPRPDRQPAAPLPTPTDQPADMPALPLFAWSSRG